jgi:phage-related protein
LPQADRGAIGEDVATVEFGWPVGMPVCRPLGNGLWEVRSNISNGRIARVIFCIVGRRMVLLHAFIKKSQKTPGHDLALALRREREIAR